VRCKLSWEDGGTAVAMERKERKEFAARTNRESGRSRGRARVTYDLDWASTSEWKHVRTEIEIEIEIEKVCYRHP